MNNKSKNIILANKVFLDQSTLSFIQMRHYDGFILFDIKNKSIWISEDLQEILGFSNDSLPSWQVINETVRWEDLASSLHTHIDSENIRLKKVDGEEINVNIFYHNTSKQAHSNEVLFAGVQVHSKESPYPFQTTSIDQFKQELNDISEIGFWKLSPDGKIIEWMGHSHSILELGLNGTMPIEELKMLIREATEQLEFSETLYQAIHKKIPFQIELTINTYKGNEKRVQLVGKIQNENSKAKYVYGFIKDITKEYRHATQSKISEEQFKLAFDQASIGMALINLDGKCIRSNISLSKILGYTQHELRSININDISLASENSRDKELFDKLVSGDMDSFVTTKRLIHKLRHEVIVLLSVTIVRNANHQPDYFFYNFNDISNIVKAERELNKTKEQLELVIKGSRAGWWDWDLNNGQPYYSARWFEMLGYDPDSGIISSELWNEIIHPEDKPKLEKYFKETINSDTTTYETEFRLKARKGNYLTINSRGYITRDSNGKAIRISGTDTDMTQELESKRRYEAIFNSSFQFTGLLMTDGTVLEANDTLIKFAQTEPDQVIGKKLWDTPAWPDNPEFINRLKESVKLVSSGKFDRFNISTISLDNEEIIIDFSMKPVKDEYGSVVLLIPEGRNITAQIKAKSELESSEARWKYALEGSGDGVWDWQMITNEIFFSPNWKIMLGFAPEEMENDWDLWRSMVYPDDLDNVLTKLYDYINEKIPSYFIEYRIRCKDGSYKWVLDRGKIVEYDESGRPSRMIGTHTDINESKQIEKQLRETISLVSSQNNRLLNFAHIVSHNLRSHAGNIATVLNFIETETDEDELKELFSMIRSASDQLTETIHNLNEVVAIQTNINEEKSKRSLLQELIKTKNNLQGLIKETNTTIQMEVDQNIEVNVIPSYLDSILLNLMTNSIKYRSPERQPLVKFEAEAKSNVVNLKIIDNGLGIDMRLHKNNVFGMYKTFHGNRDARGIGLFITKNQVEAMDGTIDLESTVGVGSIFSITLPLA